LDSEREERRKVNRTGATKMWLKKRGRRTIGDIVKEKNIKKEGDGNNGGEVGKDCA